MSAHAWSTLLAQALEPKRRYVLGVIGLCIVATALGAFTSPLATVRTYSAIMTGMVSMLLVLYVRGLSIDKTIQYGSMLGVVHGTWVSCLTQTIYTSVQAWLLVLCVTHFYLSGRRAGLRWMLVSLGVLLLSLGYKLAWPDAASTPFDQAQAVNSVTDYLLVTLGIIVVPWIYSHRYSQALAASQQRQAQLQAKQVELQHTLQMREHFIASVSHELRTPMNAILGLNTVLLERVQGKPQAHQVLAYTRQSADHLMTVINDVLDYAQFSSGRLQAHPETLELRPTVQAAFWMFSPQVADTALHYACEVDADVPQWVQADGHRLVQILVNLLGNAIKFTHQGSVLLQVSQAGDRLVFSVKDTGIGMTAQQQASVFERYRQADATIQSEYGGNGLGLTISEQLARMMGGRLSVQSQWGQGSCFQLHLPLVQAQAAAPMAQAVAVPPDLTQGRWRFLVVDDHPLNRLLARQVLQSHWPQAQIVEVDDGAKAVQACEQGPPWDAVLMDMVMPVMDGIEATRCIKSSAQASVRATPVIGLTANVNAQDLDRFERAGLHALLLKPFEPVGLRRALERLLHPPASAPVH